MNTNKSTVWTERYRPLALDDMILTDDIRNFIQDCINKKDIPHMILYGNAGTGKSTLAKVIQKELKVDILKLNGSARGDKGIASYDVIKKYATTYSMLEDTDVDFKIVYIEEADQMTTQLQDSLKDLIEELEQHTRFIFTTNNITGLSDPILSRCEQGTFNLIPSDKAQRGKLAADFFKRFKMILDNEKLEYDEKAIKALIIQKFPDFRKMIGALGRFVRVYSGQKVDDRVLKFGKGLSEELINAFKKRDFAELRKLASDVDAVSFVREFDQGLMNILDNNLENIIQGGILIGTCAEVLGHCVDQLVVLRKHLNILALKLKFKKDEPKPKSKE